MLQVKAPSSYLYLGESAFQDGKWPYYHVNDNRWYICRPHGAQGNGFGGDYSGRSNIGFGDGHVEAARLVSINSPSNTTNWDKHIVWWYGDI